MSTDSSFFDPYLTLGIPRTSTTAEIRTAYRKLVLKCHPDKVLDPDPIKKQEAVEQFQRVHRSYELLSNETERAKYDDKIRIKEARERMQATGGKIFTRMNTGAGAGQSATAAAAGFYPFTSTRRRPPTSQQPPFPAGPAPAGPRPEPRGPRSAHEAFSAHTPEERNTHRTEDPRGPPPSYEQIFARATSSAAHATERGERERENEREREREKERERERERSEKSRSSRRTSTKMEIDPSLADRVKINGTSIRIDTPTPPPTDPNSAPPSTTLPSRARSDKPRTSTSRRGKSRQREEEDPLVHATRLFEERVRASEEKEAERKRERRRSRREQLAREHAAAATATADAEYLSAHHRDQEYIDQQRIAAQQKLQALRKAAEEAAEDMRRTAEWVQEEGLDRSRRKSRQPGSHHHHDELEEKERRRAQRHHERREREREKEREQDQARRSAFSSPIPGAAEEYDYDNEKGTKIYEFAHHRSTRRSHERETTTTAAAAAAGKTPEEIIRERPDLLRKLERERERGDHESRVRQREVERMKRVRAEEEYIHAWNKKTEHLHVSSPERAFGEKGYEGILYPGEELRDTARDRGISRSRTTGATSTPTTPDINVHRSQHARGTSSTRIRRDVDGHENPMYTSRSHGRGIRGKSRSEDYGRFESGGADKDTPLRRAETTSGRSMAEQKPKSGPEYLDAHTVSPERYSGRGRLNVPDDHSAFTSSTAGNVPPQSYRYSQPSPPNISKLDTTSKSGIKPMVLEPDERLHHSRSRGSRSPLTSPLRSPLRERKSIHVDSRLSASTSTSPSLASPGTTTTASTTTPVGTPSSTLRGQGLSDVPPSLPPLTASSTVKEKARHFDFGMTALFEKASAPIVHNVPLDSIPKRRVRDPAKPAKISSREAGTTSRVRDREVETSRVPIIREPKRDDIRYSKSVSASPSVSANLPVTENGDIKYTTAKNILAAATTEEVSGTATSKVGPISLSGSKTVKSSKSYTRSKTEDSSSIEGLAHRYKASVY